MTEEAANLLIKQVLHFNLFAITVSLSIRTYFTYVLLCLQVPEWNLVNEGGMLKLHRSWKVKSFTKGLEFFEAVASVAEAEGIPFTTSSKP